MPRPSFVRTVDGTRRTPDEDGYILVLATPLSPTLALAAPISCDWRPGDVWKARLALVPPGGEAQ